jgi:tetratricopeptide (TPR) repeat protein
MQAAERSLSPALVLALGFSALYVAAGPGSFFSVDEVNTLETAQAVWERGTLEGPAINGTLRGVLGGYYSIKPPGLAYVCLPLVALGNLLDDASGSLRGGTVQGPPLGTEEHPLRWGGRLAVFSALVTNALLGGATVVLLFLIGRRLGASLRASLLTALVSGLATPLASESTHLFRHPLEALGLLLGFWFFSDKEPSTLRRRMLLGAGGLSIAFLAGPNTAAPAVVLWLYGIVKAWKETEGTGDTRSRVRRILGPAALGVTPALVGLALHLWFNHLRFGGMTEFAYQNVGGQPAFSLRPSDAMLAVSAYLVSPALSVLLFAPPLFLVLVALRESLRRWPLEAGALVLAAGAQLLPIAAFRYWHGAVAFGPRYLLVSILLLMPLALPVLERIERGASGRLRTLFAVTLALGLLVEILGLSVYVTVNEWRMVEAGYADAWSPSGSPGRWVYVASLSPILVHLREALAGRNLVPWALRVINQPGPPLAFLALLAALVGTAALWLFRFYRSGDGSAHETRLPERLVVALAFLIGLGFLFTGRVTEPLPARIPTYLKDGMAAHRQGRHVMAQELYALVLGLEPRNGYALHNLGLLHESAGQPERAIKLFRRALAVDPGFTMASAGLARLGAARSGAAAPPASARAGAPEPENAVRCHSRAQAFWDAGDKRAALEAWKECARRFPAQKVFLRNVARCRYDLGDFEGAVRDYRELAAALPADLVARTDLAWALLRAGRLEEARSVCAAVLARDPGNAAARAILGQTGR